MFVICSWIGQIQQVITATPRQIESLIRLSEALARIRFSEWVSIACFVYWLGMVCSLRLEFIYFMMHAG